MGQETSAVAGASRAHVVNNHGKLSYFNDNAALRSLDRTDAELRSDQELDNRAAAMRGQYRNEQHKAARLKASMSAHRLGVPLPAVPIYRTHHELNAELAARGAIIQQQAFRNETLERALTERQAQLQQAAISQQAMQNDMQRRQAKYESDLAAWKTLYSELDREKREYQGQIERVQQEARNQVEQAWHNVNVLRGQMATIHHEYTNALERLKDHQAQIEQVRLRAQQAEYKAAHSQQETNSAQRKYDAVEEDFRSYKAYVSRKACDECYPRLRPRRWRRYYDSFGTSGSRRSHGSN